MYFDALKADYRQQCLEPDFRMENKQRLNLSEKATEILLRDAKLLGSRMDVSPGGKLSSTILNHVFRCYCEGADSSVEQGARRVREELAHRLESLPDTEEKNRIMDLLTDVWREQTRKVCAARLKKRGVSLNFRIDQKNLEYLVSENCQQEAGFYNNQVGEYIKAVLEEYAELPFVRRERIYCKTVCDEVWKASANQNMLKITLRSVNPETGLHNIMYVKPYLILTDSEQLYNYLTGFTLQQDEESWLPGSVRLTSILRCEERLSSGFLSVKQKKELNRIIGLYGVQYMANRSQEEEIRVRLTKQGEKLYSRLLHLRPAYEEQVPGEPGTYIFSCSPQQADNYFFKFGPEAEILKPDWLREKFRNKYRSSLEVYGE